LIGVVTAWDFVKSKLRIVVDWKSFELEKGYEEASEVEVEVCRV